MKKKCFPLIKISFSVNHLRLISLQKVCPVYETAKETLIYRTVFWTLWERERVGWFGEWHWNTYNIIYGMSRQSRFDARYWMFGAGALGRPRGMLWGRRREESSGWGTHVYLWQIHFDVWQNQYNIVKFKNKIKLKEKKKGFSESTWYFYTILSNR